MTETTTPPPVHHYEERLFPRPSLHHLAQGPVRPLHSCCPARDRHRHQGFDLLGSDQPDESAVADVDHRRRRAGGTDRRADRWHRHQRRLGARPGRRRRGGPVRRSVRAARTRGRPGDRRHRGVSERLARRVPRARTVHRHPGHARPGPRPRLRLRQWHPDQPGGGVDVRHLRADHHPGLPGPGHHLAPGGGGLSASCSTAPSGGGGSTPSAPTRRRPAARASRSRRPCGRSTSWPACSSVSAAGCSCAASPAAPRPPAT